jgi:hypothetical protein
MKTSSRWLEMFAAVLACTMPLTTSAQIACAVAPNPYLQRLDTLISSAERMRTHIDRTAFDRHALLDAADYEADFLIAFVKQQIAFEQYPGALRGPEGTLSSRSGNALDQSLLLASLLRDAGFDARIARAELDTGHAMELLGEMRRERSPYPAIGSAEGISQAMLDMGLLRSLDEERKADLARSIAAPPPVTSTPRAQQAQQWLADVTRALDSAGLVLGSTTAVEDLAREASDYFWVQYRDSAAGDWTDIHPAFHEEPTFKPTFSVVYTESIPADLQHRFRFQVFIEKAIGNKLETHALTAAWERPTANLNGVTLVFYNVPDTLMSNVPLTTDVVDALERATFFAPAFGSAVAEGAQFFDSHGTLISPEVVSAPGAGLFKTLGGSFGSALEGLGGQGLPQLTGQWIEFTFIAPDGSQRSYRRMTLDRIGAEARRKGVVPAGLKPAGAADLRPLMQRHSFMVATGVTPRGKALDSSLEHIVRQRPLLEAIASDRSEPPSPETLKKLQDLPQGWGGHAQLFADFDRVAELFPETRIYRSGPALVVQREGLSPTEGALIRAIDIVQNPARAVSWRDDRLVVDARGVVAAGVWETAFEGMALDQAPERFNTFSVFSSVVQSAADVSVLRPGITASLPGLSPDTLSSIQDDLDRGFAVIVPHGELPQGGGWWRVQPLTGETLGQISPGHGSEVTSWVELVSFGLSVAGTLVNQLGCMVTHGAAVDSGNYGGFACCSLVNLLSFATGSVLGDVHIAAGAAWDVAGTANLLDAPCGVLDN